MAKKKHNPDLLDDQFIESAASTNQEDALIDEQINDVSNQSVLEFEQQIKTLKAHNSNLRKQVARVSFEKAEMAGDVRSTVLIFKNVLEVLGIKPEDLGDNSNLIKKIPRILGGLATDIAAGTFNTQAVADVQSLTPLMDKYKYLFEDLLNSKNSPDE